MQDMLNEMLLGGDVDLAVAEAKTDKFAFWNALLVAGVAQPEELVHLIEFGKAVKAADGAGPKLGWALRETFEIYDKPTEAYIPNSGKVRDLKMGQRARAG